MAENQEGIEYEKHTYNALKKYGITTGSLATARKGGFDIKIKRKGNISGLELKLKPTSAGSIVMQYEDGEWHFGDTDTEEKEFLKSVGDDVGIIKQMNRKWKTPVLQYEDGKKTYVGAPKKKAFDIDMKKFGSTLGAGDIYQTVPTKVISDYYNAKKSYYLNIGTKGLYLLNSKDPLNMNFDLRKKKLDLIPDFSNSAGRTMLRVRCQPKNMRRISRVSIFVHS